jgi:hypothetical protein
MRKYLLLAALAVGLIAPAIARADGFFRYGEKQPDQYGFRKTHAQRAAPWFLYWPYPAYFTYPAPTGAPVGPEYMSTGGQFPMHLSPGGPPPGSMYAPYPTNGFGQ